MCHLKEEIRSRGCTRLRAKNDRMYHVNAVNSIQSVILLPWPRALGGPSVLAKMLI